MLTEDWMMRQVDALARSIAYLVFQKESTWRIIQSSVSIPHLSFL